MARRDEGSTEKFGHASENKLRASLQPLVPIPPGQQVLTLGRGDECDIVVDHPSLSRKHARLRIDERIFIEDLRSTNGSFVDGERLTPFRPVPVAIASAFRLGAVTMHIHTAQVANAAAAASASANAPPASAQPSTPAGVVHDPAMQALYGTLDTVAPTSMSVLVLGETGVGKELLAAAVHQRSTRAKKPFLTINCAALPQTLLEAELFGNEKGAFTGAVEARPGLFEAAHGGTVFLDEVGEMPKDTQAKLLRVLESGEVLRIGARKSTRVDVRCVAATNRDLRAMVDAGEFRSDLYFRLDGITLHVPPLRERPADVEPLARHFIARLAAQTGATPPALGPSAKDALARYRWPGNVRELKNIVERAVVMHPTARTLEAQHLRFGPDVGRATRLDPSELGDVPPARSSTARLPPLEVEEAPTQTSLTEELEALERKRILEALAKAGGNQKEAARLLGIGRHALIKRLEDYGVARPRKKTDG